MKQLGIIVARFQVPTLHAGHIHFLTEAAKQSDKLVIFLGYKINQPDIKNPFSLAVRIAMVRQVVASLGLQEKIIIDSIEDHPISNELWSIELDTKIAQHKEILSEESGEEWNVSLFGSRDSFAKSYFGVYDTVEIKEAIVISGTDMRGKIVGLSEEDLTDAHREGIVYGLQKIYPVGMSVVDIAVYKKVEGEMCVLLGRKPRETSFRLIGGFFDVDKDDTLEDAALRELREEVGGIVVGRPQYLMSKKIDDWRYRDNQHKIVSSLFVVEYISGEAIPADDIAEVVWVKQDELLNFGIVENHKMFMEKVIAYVSHMNKK